jgi:hypothetical protein
LSFRSTREEMLQLNREHFVIGLIGTWVVGVGRYWDDPNASLMQHLGLGSVIYIFILSLFIWIIIKPYFVENWNYFIVLTFVSLTSFPAIVYAIPVERYFDMDTASLTNVWFLILVAVWRLSLLYFFLRRFTQLGSGYIWVGTLLPVCIIITVLTMLNLERAVFDIMGGLRNETSKDEAYKILILLTLASIILVIPLLILYLNNIYNRWKIHKTKSRTDT